MRIATVPLLLGLALAGAASAPAADTLTRITDLVPGDDDGLDGLAGAVVGNELFFVGWLAAGGEALYHYDGVGSPAMVPGSDAADPAGLVAWNGKLYFGGGPNSDRELWSYDPVGGAIGEAVDVRPTGNAIPESIAAFGDRICFASHTDSQGRELACWDGSGGADVHDLVPGPDSSFPTGLYVHGGALYFVASDGADERLWRFDGQSAPAVVAAAPGDEFEGPCCLAGATDGLYFQAFDAAFLIRLWRYDGVNPPAPVSETFEPTGWTGVFRGRPVVGGENPSTGVAEELWRRGPAGLRRLSPGTILEQSDALTTMRDALFLRSYVGGADDFALHRFCGAGGVVTVADPRDGDPAITSDRLVAFNGRLYFAATDATFGEELWAFDSSHLFCDDFESADASAWSNP